MLRPQSIKIDFPELQQAVAMDQTFRPSPNRDWLELGRPGRITHRQAELPIRGLHSSLDGLRILHLSDLHMRRRWHRAYDRLLADIQSNVPDLILFTGDFVECKFDHRPALPYLQRFVKGLAAKHGIFAILGNHDPDIVRPYVAEHGMVTHRIVTVKIGDGEVEIIGLPGLSRADLDMDFIRSVPPPRQGVPRIVLSHYPDYFPAARNLQMDLFLGGHTHGGQVCFPNGKPVITHDSMPHTFCKGVHRIGRTWFAVNNGLGFSGVMVRMFCPSEIGEFTLRCGTEDPVRRLRLPQPASPEK